MIAAAGVRTFSSAPSPESERWLGLPGMSRMSRTTTRPKAILVLCMAVFAVFGNRANADDLSGGGTREVEKTLRAYEDAWSRHDAHGIAGFYNEPAMRVSPSGPVVRDTRVIQEAFFAGLLDKLVKQGYATSTWELLEIRLLESNTALASGVVVRHRNDGSVLQRQGVTYTLWRTDHGWKIFLSATHEASVAIQFQSDARPP